MRLRGVIKGLVVEQIIWNLERCTCKIPQIFEAPIQNNFLAFKFRAQVNFKLFENTHSPGFENLYFTIFWFILQYKYTQIIYIDQIFRFPIRYAKLKAISNLFSFFYTPCIRTGSIPIKMLRVTVISLIIHTYQCQCVQQLLQLTHHLVILYLQKDKGYKQPHYN